MKEHAINRRQVLTSLPKVLSRIAAFESSVSFTSAEARQIRREPPQKDSRPVSGDALRKAESDRLLGPKRQHGIDGQGAPGRDKRGKDADQD